MGQEVLPEQSFKNRLKRVVDEIGSAEKLARRANVSSRIIGKYLSGDSLPGLDKLVSIAKAADVHVEWLATGEGPMKKGEGRISEAQEEYRAINPKIMREIVEGVEGYLTENKLQMPPNKKAELLIYLYEVFAKEGQVDRGQVIRLVRMMAA